MDYWMGLPGKKNTEITLNHKHTESDYKWHKMTTKSKKMSTEMQNDHKQTLNDWHKRIKNMHTTTTNDPKLHYYKETRNYYKETQNYYKDAKWQENRCKTATKWHKMSKSRLFDTLWVWVSCFYVDRVRASYMSVPRGLLAPNLPLISSKKKRKKKEEAKAGGSHQT